MRSNYLTRCILGAALYCSSLAAFNITRVETTSDVSDRIKKMEIDFEIDAAVSDWLFGFYMPRTFITSGTINPSLTIEIFEDGNLLNSMHYVKISENPVVFGNGTVNTFAPDSSTPLSAGKKYTVVFSDSDQFIPLNLSSVAQSFFLYNVTKSKFLNGLAPLSAYGDNIFTLKNIGGYDFAAVQAEIKQHITDNWNASSPLIAGQLADVYHLVPTPQTMSSIGGGGMSLRRRRFLTLFDAFGTDKALQSSLKTDLNLRVVSTSQAKGADIVIQKNKAISDPEGYKLKIQNNQIIIEAATDTGAFYGIQTLRQLWHQTVELPAVSITDAPRFKYRGVLLDVARHIFTVAEIKKLIDAMAAQKLNTLHIHFSDDEGWRLALSSLLLEVLDKAELRGFVKGSTNPPGVFSQANVDITNYLHAEPSSDPSKLIESTYPQANTAYDGIYTAQDIKDLVTYANQNKITIIPELDFPGHSCAIVHANPEVFFDPNDLSEYVSVQGYYNDVIPVCSYDDDEEPINAFSHTMNTIVSAMESLFAGQTTVYYQNEVSLGADEVATDAWTSDVTCSCCAPWTGLTALSKSHLFFKLMALSRPDLKISGYQQLVQNDDETIGTNAMPAANTGHIWVWNLATTGAIEQAKELAKNQYPTVLSFADDVYFDLVYTPDAWEPGFYWASSFLDTYAALSSAIDANAVLLNLANKKYILGIEGALWGENMMNFRHLAYMALPKMAGLAEASWSKKTVVSGKINWKSLAHRLGTGNKGFLDYLFVISGFEYRGYPHGISMEIP